MATIKGAEPPEFSTEGEGLERPTPEDAAEDFEERDGLRLARPRKNVVGEYAERPYRDAVTGEHLERLRAAGQAPDDDE